MGRKGDNVDQQHCVRWQNLQDTVITEEKYNIKIPFTELYGIIDAIPRDWKSLLNNDQGTEWNEMTDYKLIDKMDDTNRMNNMLYNMLIQGKHKPPLVKAEKWNQEIGKIVELKTCLAGLEKCRLTTINNKLRSFNYIFFMRNVPYGKRLYYMKIKKTPNCPACKEKSS